jgi:hypothetical protein
VRDLTVLGLHYWRRSPDWLVPATRVLWSAESVLVKHQLLIL